MGMYMDIYIKIYAYTILRSGFKVAIVTACVVAALEGWFALVGLVASWGLEVGSGFVAPAAVVGGPNGAKVASVVWLPPPGLVAPDDPCEVGAAEVGCVDGAWAPAAVVGGVAGAKVASVVWLPPAGLVAPEGLEVDAPCEVGAAEVGCADGAWEVVSVSPGGLEPGGPCAGSGVCAPGDAAPLFSPPQSLF